MFMKQQKKKKGQSTLEYIILLTGIVAVMLMFLSKGSPFARAYNKTLTLGTNGMEQMANRLRFSRP